MWSAVRPRIEGFFNTCFFDVLRTVKLIRIIRQNTDKDTKLGMAMFICDSGDTSQDTVPTRRGGYFHIPGDWRRAGYSLSLYSSTRIRACQYLRYRG